jgi:hypothetical protein
VALRLGFGICRLESLLKIRRRKSGCFLCLGNHGTQAKEFVRDAIKIAISVYRKGLVLECSGK